MGQEAAEEALAAPSAAAASPAKVRSDDALFALLDELRGEGFSLGVGEYLDARRAVAACHGDGICDDHRRLRNYLAPVLCTNPEQQQLFYRHFDDWWVHRAGGRPEDLEPPRPLRSLREELPDVALRTRPWKWQAVSVLAAAFVVAALVWWSSIYSLGVYAAGLWRSWFVLGDLTVTTSAADGAALAGVQLLLKGEGGEASGATDKSGRLRVKVPRGHYRLTATRFGFASASRTVEVLRKPSELRLPLAPLPRGALAGLVTDLQGRGIPRARISLHYSGTGDSDLVMSDATGAFAFTPLPEGIYEVTAGLPGFESVHAPGHVVAGRRTGMRLELAQDSVRVHVTDSLRRPLGEATVTRVGGTERRQTSADGVVEFGLRSGKWRFAAQKEGFEPNQADILVSAGKMAEVSIALVPSRTRAIAVTVVDLGGKPLLDTAVHWDDIGKALATLRGHTRRVFDAAFSPDGTKIVTASGDQTARIWSVATGRFVATLAGHTGTVWTAVFSPDSARVVTASNDGTARIWNAATGRLGFTLTGHTNSVQTASFSPDGNRVVTASDDGTARIWNAATGAPLLMLTGHTKDLNTASFSPDGTRVVTTSRDRTARIWNAATGALLFTLTGHTGGVWDAVFSSDGARLVTRSDDGTARIWNVVTGRLLLTLAHTAWVNAASFSPDGTRVVTTGDDRAARIWNAATGRLIFTLKGHTEAVRAASFGPDGAAVVTGSDDGTARIWDAATGGSVATLTGHTDRVTPVSFSPDGGRVLTASADDTARIWNALDAAGPILAATDGSGGAHLAISSASGPPSLLFRHPGYGSPPPFRVPNGTAGGKLRVVLAPQTLWERLLPHRRKIQTALAVLPLVFAGPWFAWRIRSRRQLVLERRTVHAEKATAPRFLPEPIHQLYRDASLARTRVEVARRERAGQGALDPDATVEATVRGLGFFTPVYRARLDLPLYLVLIDGAGPRDQRARMVDELLDRLQADGVQIDRYDFDRDPRSAVMRVGTQIHRDLRALAGLYPRHRLAVFTDGAGFFDPATGQLARWVELLSAWPRKALLTPVPVCDWRRREHDLKDAGFVVVPATEAGVERLAEALRGNRGIVAKPLDDTWQPPYPNLIATRPGRYVERNPPEEWEISALCGELAFYLGPHGYRWLCALAIYPNLEWYLTLYLGLQLRHHDDRAVLDEATLMAMTRLPWLRYGSMPDWLRLRLLRDLSKADETHVRSSLYDLLKKRETSGSRFRLDVARPPEPAAIGLGDKLRRWVVRFAWRRVIKLWASTESEAGPLHDQVFIGFMLGKKPSKLQVLVPSDWMGWVWDSGMPALGLSAGVILLCTTFLSTLGPLVGGGCLEWLALHHGTSGQSRVVWASSPAPIAPSYLKPCPLPFEAIATRPDPAASCRFEGCFSSADRAFESLAKNSFCIDPSSATDLDDFTMFRSLQARTDGKQTGDRSQLRAISPLGEGSIVRLAAYIKEAHISDCAGGENVNCQLTGFINNDIHIPLVQDPADDECLSVTAEMSPHFRPAAWSQIDEKTPLNRLVRITGPLFYDNSHTPCTLDAKNQITRRSSPARVSVWEIHPVYGIDVCDTAKGTDCEAADTTGWTPYDQWASRPGAMVMDTGGKQRLACNSATPVNKPCAGIVAPQQSR